MKRFSALLITMLVVILAMSVFACQDKTATITFETNGGNEISKVEVKIGEEYTLPTPQKANHEFVGWFLSQDLSGTAVTKVKADKSITVYAKWEQLFTVTLNLDGGTLSTSSVALKAGSNIYNAVKDYVPTKADHSFGGWFYGDNQLSEFTEMPSENITLTAKYKIGYKVELYLQNIAGDSYVKAAEDVTAYDYVGATVSYTQTLTGFEKTTHASAVESLQLTSTVASNVLKIYFNRRSYTVTYKITYPDGMAEADIVVNAKYEQELEVLSNYSAVGYYLAGWRTTAGDIEYATNYLDANLFGSTTAVSAQKFNVTSNITLNPIWEKGYIDVFGGKDYIFLDKNNNDVAYLSRQNILFKGTFNSNTKTFTFRDANNNVMVTGKIVGDDHYSYQNPVRGGYTYTLYTKGVGLDQNTKAYFDAYNGITYSIKTGSVTAESKGTYIIGEEGYIATFTTGVLIGQTINFFTAELSDGTNVFLVRDEEAYNLGSIYRFYVDGFDLSYTTNYQLILDGYGTAIYIYGTSGSYYFYSYDSEKSELTLMNYNSGQTVAVMRIINEFGVNGFMLYEKALDATFTLPNGDTLKLDGLYQAEYKRGSTTVTGKFDYYSTNLSNYILTLFTFDSQYTFTFDGDLKFQVKENSYNEYFLFDDSCSSYAPYDNNGKEVAPMLAIDDAGVGTASLYGYNKKASKFQKISSGTYAFNDTTKLYTYTAVKSFDATGVDMPIIDLATIESFTYAIDDQTLSFNVFTWYSITTTGGQHNYNDSREYVSEDGESTLVISGGFATYIYGEIEIKGVYTVEDGYIVVTAAFNGNAINIYIELNDETGVFIEMTMPHTSLMLETTGAINSKYTLAFNGKGGAVYTEEDTSYEGTIVNMEETTYVGAPIYKFVSNDGTIEFKFIELSTSSANYFTKFNPDYNGTYTSSEHGTLLLDGYGFMARYTDVSGTVYEGMYFLTSNNVIVLYLYADDTYFYFDVDGTSFTLRGDEFNSYLLWNNNDFEGIYVELDGYGGAMIYTVEVVDKVAHRVFIDEEASYTVNGDEYTVVYKDGDEEITIVGKLSVLVFSSDEAYPIFVVLHKEVARLYVNEADWTILVLDDMGNAKRYDTMGMEESGQFLIITDSLVYFVNDAGTDACIYNFDKATGKMTRVSFTRVSYYTKDLETLVFSQYGFADFEDTQYYYTKDSNENITIFRRAEQGEEANEYGFVEINFGKFDNQKEWEGKTYYLSTGFAVVFVRDQETYDLYPVPVTASKKAPIERLVFLPGIGTEYATSGTIIIDGNSYSCNVIRTAEEFYIYISGFYFDIEIVYGGENPDGSPNSSFVITGMRYIESYYSYTFLEYHYTAAYYFGMSIPNTFGYMEIITEFDENGDEVLSYVVAAFGANSEMYDINGNIVSIDHDGESETNYAYYSDSKLYVAEFEAADGYTYRLYFMIALFSGYNMYGYRVYAFTRVETISVDGYDVRVERVIATETTMEIGSIFYVTLKYDGEFVCEESAAEIYIMAENILLYVAREYNDDGFIISTTYYAIYLTEAEGEFKTDVIPYESVAVDFEEMETVYAEDEESFVDISVEDGVVMIVFEGNVYFADECEYSNGTYTVTCGDTTFTVTIATTSEGKVATITEVEDEEAAA